MDGMVLMQALQDVHARLIPSSVSSYQMTLGLAARSRVESGTEGVQNSSRRLSVGGTVLGDGHTFPPFILSSSLSPRAHYQSAARRFQLLSTILHSILQTL